MNNTLKLLTAAALSSQIAPLPVAARDALPTVEPGGGSAFRAIRAPRPGQKRRISLPTISPGIGPNGGASGEASPGASGPSPGAGASRMAAWFWDRADPARAAADPARMARLLDDLAPRLAQLVAGRDPQAAARRVMRAHGPALRAAARAENLSPALILAVIGVESAGREKALSPKGAQGLMQLMPATARRFGVRDAFDPAQNIAGGARYLNELLERYDGDAVLALAAYNAGEGAVDRHGGAPPYAETRAYVPTALAWFAALRPLCAAPPDGPRAACEIQAPPGVAAAAPVRP